MVRLSRVQRCFLVNQSTVKKWILLSLLVCTVSLLYCLYYVANFHIYGFLSRLRPDPSYRCAHPRDDGNFSKILASHSSPGHLHSDLRVLLFVETSKTKLGRSISEMLVANRVKYKLEVTRRSLPMLTSLDKGRYGVIIFENIERYLLMDEWNRGILDKYCHQYGVGIIGFYPQQEETLVGSQLPGLSAPLRVHTNLKVQDAFVNMASPVLRVTRAGDTVLGKLHGDSWNVFSSEHHTYLPIELAKIYSPHVKPKINDSETLYTVVQDTGAADGIQRIIFGFGLDFWLHRLLLLDSLNYLSKGRMQLSLTRHILVDIDDIFVGKKGTRMEKGDVAALIEAQKRLARVIPGFKFNLGFSGHYFHHGTNDENYGEDYLMDNVDKFWWFPHMWNHMKPHHYGNASVLKNLMYRNYDFAKRWSIPVDSGYSVAPHHSGVYPVHEPLYEAWKEVWHIRVTSTEEYPRHHPARLRRGFIHKGIMVLPRQTCGLYTHTILMDDYPGGKPSLDSSIYGGEVFQTILNNHISVFMTHLSNYGNDRLAIYLFESVVKFIECWTNLELQTLPPLQLGELYFNIYPEEADPVWGNPCLDRRHQSIWHKEKSCLQLPKLLVIGPQKTGTTALYTFLSMHPNIKSNYPSPETYEEIQFFNGKNYHRGIDWYMKFFPVPTNEEPQIMFEKSATYFDGELVPRRAFALLPRAHIVAILISPAKRAYSWYQHQRAKGDATANNFSFYEVITAREGASRQLRDLRNRCLEPGRYSSHLERWLGFFPSKHVHILDGEALKRNPIHVMNQLQHQGHITPFFDYANHLRFDPKKGFYCQVIHQNTTKCLGRSKGRKYPPMDLKSFKYLQAYYMSANTALEKLFKRLGYPIPEWLEADLSGHTL